MQTESLIYMKCISINIDNFWKSISSKWTNCKKNAMTIYNKNLLFIRKTLYVLLWGAVSLISSYNDIISLNFKFIETELFYEKIIAPLLIWTLAFFVDYIYTISMLEDKIEKLDKKWSQCSHLAIGLIFVILLLSIFHHDGAFIRTIWMGGLFVSMMSLKVASLNVVRPIVNVIER